MSRCLKSNQPDVEGASRWPSLVATTTPSAGLQPLLLRRVLGQGLGRCDVPLLHSGRRSVGIRIRTIRSQTTRLTSRRLLHTPSIFSNWVRGFDGAEYTARIGHARLAGTAPIEWERTASRTVSWSRTVGGITPPNSSSNASCIISTGHS
jgi:hypothetical protein